MADTVSVTPAAPVTNTDIVQVQKPFRLFDLPQELQDSIFAFAYPEKATLDIVFKELWERAERRKRKADRTNYIPSTFPNYKVSEWLISKRYFVATARAWFGAQTFGGRPYEQSRHRPRMPSAFQHFVSESHGLRQEFARSAYISMTDFEIWWHHLAWLLGSKNVKNLTIGMTWREFETGDGKWAWEDILSREQLMHALKKFDTRALHGIQTLHVVETYCEFARTERQKQVLRANTSLLQQVLRQWAFQPRVQATQHTVMRRVPLYLGSTVMVQPTQEKRKAGADATDVTALKKIKTKRNAFELMMSSRPKPKPFKEISLRSGGALQDMFSEALDLAEDADDRDLTLLVVKIKGWIAREKLVRGTTKYTPSL